MFLAEFDDHRHVVTTSSAEVSYVEIGAGPPALFVHGIATNAYIWRELITRLADVRRCVAVDLPLHGQSPAGPEQELTIGAFADVLAEACQRLGLMDVDLVAHDTGGAIAQVLAARHPELLRTLTLTNCETQDNIPPAAMAATASLARDGKLAPSAPGILADPASARSFFAVGYQDPEFLAPELVSAFLEPVVGTPAAAERFQELIAGLGPADLLTAEPGLRELHTPTLIVWGTDDAFFDLKWAYWLLGTIPSAREVTEIAGGKLFFPHERSGELAPHIRRHWTTAGRALESDPDAKRSDLIDGLCDLLDEYDAGEADFSALVHDTDSVIVELAPLSDATWIANLRGQWKVLAGVLHELKPTAAGPRSSSQLDRVAAAARGLRRFLAEA